MEKIPSTSLSCSSLVGLVLKFNGSQKCRSSHKAILLKFVSLSNEKKISSELNTNFGITVYKN